MDPASRFESILDVPVAALDNEDFGVGFHSIFLLPLLHVGYVQLHGLRHGLVALEEVIEGFGVDRFGRRLGWTGQIVAIGIVATIS